VGKRILGYYAATSWTDPSDLWALDVLAEEGYAYDSSVAPSDAPSDRALAPLSPRAPVRRPGTVGISAFQLGPDGVADADLRGNYFRQFPHTLVKGLVESWHRSYDAPFVMYFNVWELDPDLPRLNAASPLARIRQYRNLDRCRGSSRTTSGYTGSLGSRNTWGSATLLTLFQSPAPKVLSDHPEGFRARQGGRKNDGEHRRALFQRRARSAVPREHLEELEGGHAGEI